MISFEKRARTIVDDWCSEWAVLDRERLQRQIVAAIEAAVEELEAQVCGLEETEDLLEAQLASANKAICGMREALELLNDIKDDQSLEWTKAIDILDEALVSAPKCPHKEEAWKEEP